MNQPDKECNPAEKEDLKGNKELNKKETPLQTKQKILILIFFLTSVIINAPHASQKNHLGTLMTSEGMR